MTNETTIETTETTTIEAGTTVEWKDQRWTVESITKKGKLRLVNDENEKPRYVAPEDVEVVEEEESIAKIMAKTLNAYKPNYAHTTAYSGSASQDNADEVAKRLRGMSPTDVATLAEKVLGMKRGSLLERYAGLNPGQVRMNSGNLIRNAIRRGDLDAAKVLAA